MSGRVLTLRTPAKVNPVLEVLSLRPDGYHELSLIFQAVSIFDELSFSLEGEPPLLIVEESPEPLDVGGSNLIMKAVLLFARVVLKRPPKVRIRLRKRIPLTAGMGGGSSDAAATLMALDHLFETRLGLEKLLDLGSQLGSDVPFFLTGGTGWGRGRGEKVTPLDPAPEMDLVLVKPQCGLSTPSVFRSGKALLTDGKKAESFPHVLASGGVREISGALFNGLEPAAISLLPQVAGIKERLLQAGALGALLSGSGPTVFGLTEGPREAKLIAEKLEGQGWSVLTAKTLSTGIEFL